jgi:hypothetical protein
MADPSIRQFLEKYEARYDELPASDNAYRGYDAASVLITGIGPGRYFQLRRGRL